MKIPYTESGLSNLYNQQSFCLERPTSGTKLLLNIERKTFCLMRFKIKCFRGAWMEQIFLYLLPNLYFILILFSACYIMIVIRVGIADTAVLWPSE
jgi:hypothetical protein